MIAYIQQLLLVIRHEMRMVLRSWPFRIVAFLCFCQIVLQNAGMMAMIYFVSAEAYLGPLFTSANITILAMVQIAQLLTWVVVFFANSVGSRDRRIGIADVVAARPLPVGSYVIGRILGLMLPLTVLMVASLAVTLVAQNAFGLHAASFRQYAPYFLAFSLVSVSFAAALAAFFSTLLKNRLLTSLAALAPIMLSALWLARVSSVFDMSGFLVSGTYSDLIGFGPLGELVSQRLIYVCLVLFFVAATVFFYPRPEASRRGRPTVFAFVVLLLASVGLMGNFALGEYLAKARHQDWRGALTEATGNRAAAVDHYDMEVSILPRKGQLRAAVKTALRNRSATGTDSFIFALNPGLDVESVTTSYGASVAVARRGPVVELTLDAPLPPGESVELTWEYGGKVDPRAAWLSERPESETWQEDNMQQMASVLGDLSGWTGRRYCFFLPESQWYPVPNSTFGYEYPDKRPVNFATARIHLEMPEDWTGVTQGVLVDESRDGGRATLVYETDTPVPQFSLCAGEYERVSAEVNGIECAFFYAPAHRENVDLFADAAEEIARSIGESLDAISDELHLEYPYRSLAVVEVPIDCRPFSDGWDSRNLFVQPGVLFLSETNFFSAYFAQAYKSAEKWTKRQGTGATNAQIKAGLLKKYFHGNAFVGDLELNLIPNFWEFLVDPTGTAYPALGPAFTNALAERALGRHQRDETHALEIMNQPGLAMAERQGDDVAEFRQAMSFWFPTRDPDPDALIVPLGAMSPAEQGKRFIPLMDKKTDGLFQTLAMAMGEDAWQTLVPYVLDRYRFKPIALEDVEREARSFSDTDVSWVFDQFVSRPIMPGYAIVHAEAYEIDIGQRDQQFQAVVRVANLEEGKGYARLVIESKGSDESDTIEREVFFDSLEEKEVRVVLSAKPVSVRVVPAFSRNMRDPFEILYVPDERQATPGEDSIRTVSTADRELAVIVDDVESGFSTVATGEGASQDPGGPTEYRKYIGFGAPRRWQNQNASKAYGKYIRTRKIKKRGDGSQTAVWSASLPQEGLYEVFIYAEPARRGRYMIVVEHGESRQEVELGLKTAKSGWNSLGKYWFPKDGPARVTLSDDVQQGSKGSRVYADAVKWVHQDTAGAVQ